MPMVTLSTLCIRETRKFFNYYAKTRIIPGLSLFWCRNTRRRFIGISDGWFSTTTTPMTSLRTLSSRCGKAWTDSGGSRVFILGFTELPLMKPSPSSTISSVGKPYQSPWRNSWRIDSLRPSAPMRTNLKRNFRKPY